MFKLTSNKIRRIIANKFLKSIEYIKMCVVISAVFILISCSSGGTDESSAVEQSAADLQAANLTEASPANHLREINYVGGFWDSSHQFPDGRYIEAYVDIPDSGNTTTLYFYEGGPFGSGADCYSRYETTMSTATGQPVGEPMVTEYLISGIPYTLIRTGAETMDSTSVDTADLDQDGDVDEFITEYYIKVDNKDDMFSSSLDANLCL